MKNCFIFFAVDAACEALTDMPPRSENELDAVTLQNQALMNMEGSHTTGFEKMQFLLQQNPFPPETFGNLLLLYVKYEASTWLQYFSYDYNDATIVKYEASTWLQYFSY